MKGSLLRFLLPAYLFFCLIAGGSVQGVWAMLGLELMGLAILLIVELKYGIWRALKSATGFLPVLGLLFLALVLIELIPLPPAFWTELPGRQFLANGFELLGVPPPWTAWSIVPAATESALMPLLVPFGVVAGMVGLKSVRPQDMVSSLIVATLCGVLLGYLQVRSGGAPEWYVYRDSAFNKAAGFFANSNHMGTLLLVNVPFVVAIASDQLRARTNVSQRGLVFGAAAGLAVVLLIAVLLNRSSALLLFGGPVVLLSLAIPQWKRRHLRKWLGGGAALTLLAALAVGASQGRMGRTSEDSSVRTRVEIWTTSARAIGDLKLTGSGLGTFQRAYRHYEDPTVVDTTYVNHAHNDYLEVVVELGLPGLVLMAMFLGWWARSAASAWRFGGPYARAAAIGSATILLHSLVDFPLRTSAIAALFAMCIGILLRAAEGRGSKGEGDLWPSRHLMGD